MLLFLLIIGQCRSYHIYISVISFRGYLKMKVFSYASVVYYGDLNGDYVFLLDAAVESISTKFTFLSVEKSKISLIVCVCIIAGSELWSIRLCSFINQLVSRLTI